MNRHGWMGTLLGVLLLQGCAGNPSVHRQDVRLFAADGSARFDVYLSCSSHTANCDDVEQQFHAWAQSRGATLHVVKSNDAAFKWGKPSPAGEQAQPYRLTVHYRPDVADSVGSVYRPQVSYSASIAVIDAKTGELLKRTPYLHDEVRLDYGWGAMDAYLSMYVRDVIGHIDPSYASETAASD